MTLDLCSAIAPEAALLADIRGKDAAIPGFGGVSIGGLRYQCDTSAIPSDCRALLLCSSLAKLRLG